MALVPYPARARRQRLREMLRGQRCAVPAGRAPARNFPANRYPFRASSHFMYLVGPGPEGAVLTLDDEGQALYVPEPDPDDVVWHGERPSFEALEHELGLPIRPLGELPAWLGRGPFAAPPTPAAGSPLPKADAVGSARLRHALVSLRLRHDAPAQQALREAAQASMAAHRAGMAQTRPGLYERDVRAAMEAELMRRDCTTAYAPIVTVRAEVLHNERHDNPLHEGDLLLADVGAETRAGWAGDITRTWPVTGRFSDTQRAIYDVVWRAQRDAIARIAPGVRYRDVHLAAARRLAEGLCELGILRGSAEARVADGSYALFMPHGVGHLLGLDVHDMEDLSDAAGYPEGRARDAQFGLHALRLDRELHAGMAVTVEPGFYQVPALLSDPTRVDLSDAHVDRARLAEFSDVRGIRIEDDVLVTEDGCEVLTAALPSSASEVEALVGRLDP